MTLVGWVAVAIFAGVYVLVATERIHRVAAALGGAGLVLGLGLVSSEDAFYSRETGVDWDVIFLLLGMMLVVGVIRRTGVFEYLAIRSAKLARGRPYRVLVLLVLVTALASALLDNVTTVLLVAPVTLLLCDRLGLKPIPFLIAEALASNIGGTATLVGDPPNIIIASRADLSFVDFLIHLAPVIVVILAAFLLLARFLFRSSLTGDPERAISLMSLDEREAITDRPLLLRSGLVLAAILLGFLLQRQTGIAPSVVALVGAGVLITLAPLRPKDLVGDVEWETLLFFAGLFVMVGALVDTGAIGALAKAATQLTGGNALLTTMGILGVSAPVSGIIDNIPYVATMTPVVAELSTSLPHDLHPDALWWALALGADFGGNLTAVGASANVVMLGIARRAGTPISFWEFTRKGAVVTVVSVACAALYLWLRYFMFG